MKEWQRFSEYMEKTGCSWREFAARLNYTTPTLSRVKKTGKVSPKLLKELERLEMEAGIVYISEQEAAAPVSYGSAENATKDFQDVAEENARLKKQLNEMNARLTRLESFMFRRVVENNEGSA